MTAGLRADAARSRAAFGEAIANPHIRNVILTDHQVRAVVAAAYAISPAFGLLIETATITGQRASQLFALTVADLQNGATPRLMIPCSKKGRNRRVERKALADPPTPWRRSSRRPPLRVLATCHCWSTITASPGG